MTSQRKEETKAVFETTKEQQTNSQWLHWKPSELTRSGSSLSRWNSRWNCPPLYRRREKTSSLSPVLLNVLFLFVYRYHSHFHPHFTDLLSQRSWWRPPVVSRAFKTLSLGRFFSQPNDGEKKAVWPHETMAPATLSCLSLLVCLPRCMSTCLSTSLETTPLDKLSVRMRWLRLLSCEREFVIFTYSRYTE